MQPKGGAGMHIIESLRMELAFGLCNSLAVLDEKILGFTLRVTRSMHVSESEEVKDISSVEFY
jgi:hypothetical protein